MPPVERADGVDISVAVAGLVVELVGSDVDAHVSLGGDARLLVARWISTAANSPHDWTVPPDLAFPRPDVCSLTCSRRAHLKHAADVLRYHLSDDAYRTIDDIADGLARTCRTAIPRSDRSSNLLRHMNKHSLTLISAR